MLKSCFALGDIIRAGLRECIRVSGCCLTLNKRLRCRDLCQVLLYIVSGLMRRGVGEVVLIVGIWHYFLVLWQRWLFLL